MVDLVGQAEKMIQGHRIEDGNIEKALTIYESVLVPQNSSEKSLKFSGIESRIFSILDAFVWDILQLIERVQGGEFLQDFRKWRAQRSHKRMNSVIQEMPEDMEDSKTRGVLGDRSRNMSGVPKSVIEKLE